MDLVEVDLVDSEVVMEVDLEADMGVDMEDSVEDMAGEMINDSNPIILTIILYLYVKAMIIKINN
jgi:hypothetical protein